MSLFSKGPWVHMHLNPDALPSFKALLDNPQLLFRSSAFAARTRLLSNAEIPKSVGINPPCWPCGDAPLPREQASLDKNIHPHIAANLADEGNEAPWELPDEVSESTGVMLEMDRYWGSGPKAFQLLDAETPVYGFWLVLLKRANLDDMNALREHAAATTTAQPFKTLSAMARKEIGNTLVSEGLVDYIDRKQVPVVIDFRTGDVWLGNSGKSFTEALGYYLLHATGAKLEPMECFPGKSAEWAALALTAFYDHDINKLEREEAFQNAICPPKVTETPTEGEEGEEEGEDENAFVISDIATFASDTGIYVSVQPDACILFPGARTTSVSVHFPMDALAVLHLEPAAMISAARVNYLWTLDDCRASASVDMNAELGACAYKGLEIDFTPGAHAFLERSIPGGLLDQDGLGAANRVNRYWFRYLLALKEAERIIFSTACEALGLDPVMPTVSRLIPEEVTPVEVNVVASAVATSMKANLLPGESITITTPKGSARVGEMEVE